MQRADSPWVFDVDEADFDRLVLKKSKTVPVVVDFWAEWCPPCRMLAPVLEKIVQEKKGEVLLAKVNTDENQRLAMDYQVSALPTVVAFRDGLPDIDFTGVLAEEQVRQFVDELLPTETELLLRRAAELEGDDPAKAESIYRGVPSDDRQRDAANVGLARVLIAQNKKDDAAKLLAEVVAEGKLADEVERLRGVLNLDMQASELADEQELRGRLQKEPDNAQLRFDLGCILATKKQFPEALAMLYSAGELDFNLATAKVREMMVEIFHIVGDQSELANEYRQKLAMLLY